MCQQFRFDNKSQFRVFLAKPRKAADLKLDRLSFKQQVAVWRPSRHQSDDNLSSWRLPSQSKRRTCCESRDTLYYRLIACSAARCHDRSTTSSIFVRPSLQGINRSTYSADKNRRKSNPGPWHYKCHALPLSYRSEILHTFLHNITI